MEWFFYSVEMVSAHSLSLWPNSSKPSFLLDYPNKMLYRFPGISINDIKIGAVSRIFDSLLEQENSN